MRMGTEKKQRQARILELISNHSVGSQAEIVSLLRHDEITATQASISRDIRELGLIKLEGSYVRANGSARDGLGIAAERNELVISITPVGANLIVVRTRTGAASVIAAQLDAQHSSDIVGTLAGDDTIFVAVLSRAAQGRIMAILRSPMLR